MIHSIARSFSLRFCPSLWNRLVQWKSARREYQFWKQRARIVASCPDNARIVHVPDSGSVRNGLQLMHNGIQVLADSYYGKGGTYLIRENRGCHEPQEEVVFDAILRHLPAGSTMVELGAYWGFYSLWFAQAIPDASVHLVEPETANLDMGQRNFEINGKSGDFIQAYVGASNGFTPQGIRTVTIDALAEERNIQRINVLHSDIQGFELDMLQGASRLLSNRLVDYLFISTHSMDLHRECSTFLSVSGYQVIASVNPEESYSIDGILVATSPEISPPVFEHPSKRDNPIV